MNSKLVKASLAGAAAIALAAGGGTYASWSDFATDTGNHVGADILSLKVDQSTTQQFDDVKLAPGQARDLAFYVASRSGTTVPDANLTMTIQNLHGTEDGCDSNSEAATESNNAILDKTAANAPCNVNKGVQDTGQFTQQALYYVQAAKIADPTQCSTSNLPTVQSNKQLAQMNNVPVNLLQPTDVLSGGQGVCVLAHVFMPNNVGQYGFAADDASQGDQATFDVRFDLTQA